MPSLPVDGELNTLRRDEKNRRYLIVKGNRIVQKTHYSLSLKGQKVLASLIRSIKPGQKSLVVIFNTKQYMNMLGLQPSGTTFEGIKHTLKKVADKSFYVQDKNGGSHLWRWINYVDTTNKKKGRFKVTFNPKLRKYLFNKSLKYRTIYRFTDIMLMGKRYSPRLYEIFRSNQSRQKVQHRGLDYSLFELRYSLNLMKRNRSTGKLRHDKNGHLIFKYPTYVTFRRKVLTPAKKEINKYTEMNCKMKPIRGKGRGRKVVGINVVMTHKNSRQIEQRDDLVYCITHHIPKSEWKNWRENTIRGTFHVVHNYKHKKKNPATSVKVQKKIKQDKIPFREINMKGGKIEYYCPQVKIYIWTKRETRERLMKTWKAWKKDKEIMNANKKKLADTWKRNKKLMKDKKVIHPSKKNR